MDTVTITAAMNRRNGLLFLICFSLTFFAAPVVYVDIVQAALCNKLGASATVASLPNSMYLLGGLAPLFCSLLAPHRLERAVVVFANGVTAALIGIVCVTLMLPVPVWVPICAVVVQGLLQGFSGATSLVFMWQCLGRGTTLEGRARAFKRTFTLAPLFAVLGSLGAQYVLNGGFRTIVFPYDFALLYGLAFLCMASVSVVASRYRLAFVADEPPLPVFRYLAESTREYVKSAPLLLLFFVYGLWYCALAGASNLSLFAHQAMHRDPKEVAGLILAVRFGCKSMGGYVLGLIAERAGIRYSVVATSFFLLAGFAWAWFASGYPFLLAFGFMGAGELGGAYIPNLGLSLSRPENGARNLALLSLGAPAASFAPALHGALTDHFGFHASFAFGLLTAAAAIWLTFRIRSMLIDKPAAVSAAI
jgi:hypothetical protein